MAMRRLAPLALLLACSLLLMPCAEAKSRHILQDIPEIPDPSDPDIPDPDDPEIPDPSDPDPENPDDPDVPDPEDPENPDEPDVPDPEDPENPDDPDVPDPEDPDVPEPEDPDEPDIPGPDDPDVPDEPDEPDEPDDPDVPGPDNPDEPETPAPAIEFPYETYRNVRKRSGMSKDTLLTFTPTSDGSYSVCSSVATELPAVRGRKQLDLKRNGVRNVKINDAIGSIPFFGQPYERLAVHANGYVTAGRFTGDRSPFSPDAFFDLPPRAAALMSDLDPRVSNGKIYLKQSRVKGYVSVTYKNVAPFSSDASLDKKKSTFQIVLHKDGKIEFFYRRIRQTQEGVIGVSPGFADPSEVTLPGETDFSNTLC